MLSVKGFHFSSEEGTVIKLTAMRQIIDAAADGRMM
jgi:hypothetical protein